MTTLTGHDAIAHAARTGASLHKHADPVDGARAITLDEAREVVREDAGLVWCEVRRYVVRRYFNGAPQSDAGECFSLRAAINEAGKLFSEGASGKWNARVVVPADEPADYTARDDRGREVNVTH